MSQEESHGMKPQGMYKLSGDIWRVKNQRFFNTRSSREVRGFGQPRRNTNDMWDKMT